jgi:hypothetical protein
MAFDYTPAASGASGDAYAGRIMSDDLSFTSYDTKVVSAKYRGQEWDNEILALLARQVAMPGYGKQWTCGATDAVGDPVRISANDTVTKALATNEANSRVIGIIRHKGVLGAASSSTAETCYLAHYCVVTSLSGGTAGNPVYLSNTGTYSASAGTFSRVVGRWINTTDVLIGIDPNGLRIGTAATDTISATDSRLTNARTPVGAALTTGKTIQGVAGVAAEVDFPVSSPGGLTNLCLNPGFETVLPGTHTDASQRIQAGSITLNLPVVGWKLESYGGGTGEDFKAESDTTITGASAKSLKITATEFSTDPMERVYQLWNAAEYLEKQVYQCRGLYLSVYADVKLSTATVDACRVYITVDGTSGGQSYSGYHGNNTNWERIGLSVQIPADATEIKIGLEMYSDATNYYLDNVMAAATAAAQTLLDWQPRNPVALSSNRIDSTEQLIYTTPADTNWHTTGDGTADTDYSINDNRPAWASMAIIKSQVGGTGGAGTDFSVRPSGDTNTWFPAFSQVSGVALESMGTCVFGANGQIDLRCGHTNTDGYFFIKMWQGVNL